MREGWLGVAKSKAYGLKKALPTIKHLAEERRRILASVGQIRCDFEAQKAVVKGKPLSAEDARAQMTALKEQSLQRIKTTLQELKRVTDELMAELSKAQKHILTMSLAFKDRNKGETETKTTVESQLAGYQEILEALTQQIDFVMAVDRELQPIGQVLRRGARELALRFFEIAHDRED
jgi:hypothetical protein